MHMHTAEPKRRRAGLLTVALLAIVAVSCQAPVITPTPQPPPTAVPEPTAAATVRPPTAIPTAIVRATPSATPQPAATGFPLATPLPRRLDAKLEPELTPLPGNRSISIPDLPLAEPGHYVNVTFGYWLQYPPEWQVAFGNRPLLVSLSNLEPGVHSRQSIRESGCLIEVNAAPNIYGFTFEMLAAQIPRNFAQAERFELDGQPALRIPLPPGDSFDSEWVYAEHDERLITLIFEHGKDVADVCSPVWEKLLSTWRWFEPLFAEYRNRTYGYSIAYPREWYRFNASDEGVSISSQDPTGIATREELMEQGMLMETHIYQNYLGLELKDWLRAQSEDVRLGDDIPLEETTGVRIQGEGPNPNLEEQSGFFQGPLGKIYMVACYYPVAQKWVQRPVADALIYSITFQ
jgi:hypothetical protein